MSRSSGPIQTTAQAGTTDTLASTIDLPATILDRAGLTPYHGIQGRSFLETIQSGKPHRDELLIEFNDGAPRFGFSEPARVRSLVTADWRYSLYRDQDWGELYDLAGDPHETRNLWDSADHAGIRAHLSERLNHHLAHQMDESPLADRLA